MIHKSSSMSTVCEYGAPSDGLVEIDFDLQKDRSAILRSRDGLTMRKQESYSFQPAGMLSEGFSSDKRKEVILFGVDISSLSPTMQFLLCAGGAFVFSLAYGYLQELISVHVAGRRFALFLAVCTLAGSASWSFLLTWLRQSTMPVNKREGIKPAAAPFSKFIGLALVRAMDLALTNLAMQFLNYPAKTLIKSSKVVFTMALGVVIQHHRYRVRDYAVVLTMVFGLAVFLHADSTSDAVFHPIGVLFLLFSLVGDGVINNYSEKLMDSYSMTQDEYHTRLYTIALVATMMAAHLHHELLEGITVFLLQPGTVDEIDSGNAENTKWPVSRKALVLVLFSATGIFGASCLGAITRRFGALTMALTSTARKAMTLFLSFAMFHNTCTRQHVGGVFLFIGALIVKSVGATNKNRRRESTAVPEAEKEHELPRIEAVSRFDIPPPKPFGRRGRFMSMRDVSVGEMALDPLVSHTRHTTDTTMDFSPESSVDLNTDDSELGIPFSDDEQ